MATIDADTLSRAASDASVTRRFPGPATFALVSKSNFTLVLVGSKFRFSSMELDVDQ
jgi:hypothetical protein